MGQTWSKMWSPKHVLNWLLKCFKHPKTSSPDLENRSDHPQAPFGYSEDASEQLQDLSELLLNLSARLHAQQVSEDVQDLSEYHPDVSEDLEHTEHLAEYGQNPPRFFHSNSSSTSGASTAITTTLNKIFDKYKGKLTPMPTRQELTYALDTPDEPDKIGVEGSMKYLGDLGVKLEEPVTLTLLTELGSPTLGEFERAGFVEGWTRLRAETIAKQKAHIPSLRRGLSENPDVFTRTYKATFLLARQSNAKVVQLDEAINYWNIVLSAPSLQWSTDTTPWLDWWIEYLKLKWKKSVGKDMWDQTGVFVRKSLEDETMSWWSEEGSWPGVIDEFVAYVRAKREDGAKMDTA